MYSYHPLSRAITHDDGRKSEYVVLKPDDPIPSNEGEAAVLWLKALWNSYQVYRLKG